MNKRPDLTDATRQRFIDAFSEIYAELPIEKITVTEIARKAGHNRITFYQYFHDSYEVLEYLENEILAYMQKEIKENINKLNIFDEFIDIYSEVINSQQKIAKVLLTGQNAERTINKIKTLAKPLVIQEFHLDAADKRNDYILEFYFSGVLNILTYWLRSGQDFPKQQLANIIYHILQNGIKPQLVFL